MQSLNYMVCQSSVACTKNFWKAIHLYVQKPHTVNRKLAFSELVLLLKYEGAQEFTERVPLLYEIVATLIGKKVILNRDNLLKHIESENVDLFNEFIEIQSASLLAYLDDEKNSKIVAINKLVLKNLELDHVYELILFGKPTI